MAVTKNDPKAAIAKYFKLDAQSSELRNEAKLSDLNLDPVFGTEEILYYVEEELDIIIPDEEKAKITDGTTVGELVEFLEKYVSKD